MASDLLHAAQYVRMSTEHQQYSSENQYGVLREYAAKRRRGGRACRDHVRGEFRTSCDPCYGAT